MGEGPRIVSLISSGTEIACALGLEPNLVGRSHECDWPRSILQLPQLTEAHVDVSASSAAIHKQVTEAFGGGRAKGDATGALSLYTVDADALNRLAPDIIITQSQCKVCAVSLEQVERAVCERVKSNPKIISLEPHDLPDLWIDIEKVAAATGTRDRAAELIHELKLRFDAIAARVKPLPRPSVACVEWIDPLMVAGNWVPRLVEIAGGIDLLGAPGAHAPWLEWDKFHEADPDVIVLMPCGFGLSKTIEESARLFKHPGFRNYKAVRSGRIFAVDGNSFFNRPGPRLVESAEILAEMFHGEPAHYGHEGVGWKRLSPR